jgi:hypothetical protein
MCVVFSGLRRDVLLDLCLLFFSSCKLASVKSCHVSVTPWRLASGVESTSDSDALPAVSFLRSYGKNEVKRFHLFVWSKPCIKLNYYSSTNQQMCTYGVVQLYIKGGSNMTGTNCDLFTHKSSRSYLNHLVFCLLFCTPVCFSHSCDHLQSVLW